jgi:hypothetical protein
MNYTRRGSCGCPRIVVAAQRYGPGPVATIRDRITADWLRRVSGLDLSGPGRTNLNP